MANRFMEVDGGKLRELRKERALSQRELSRMSGVSADAISLFERGERDALGRTIRKLAEALGVEPKVLMKREE